jgi:2-phosphosulfolactate phosphatase
VPAPIHVFLSPRLFAPDDVAGGSVVVIDQLRASTTIAQALEAGAAAIVPCEEVEDARRISETLPGSLLGGERGGLRIPGFHLGNSPSEYVPRAVAGRVIVFTTTNGTQALRRAAPASRAAVGSLANRSAVAAWAADDQPLYLVCAGIRGSVCAEDVIAAGAIAAVLVERGASIADDAGALAVAAWDAVAQRRESITDALRASRGGRHLARVGLEADIELCSTVDALRVVPVRDGRGWLVAAR